MNVLIELLTTLFGQSPAHLAPLLDECQDEYCDSLIEHETVFSTPVETVSCELVI